MEKLQAVYDYLNTKGWVILDDLEEQVVLVGRSETNENYHIIANELYGETPYFLRFNRGSRLGITDQSEYEFTVLQALRRSGVTPRPFYCDPETPHTLGKGALLVEYLPGRPLNYAGDWAVAARVLAAVHSQPVDGRLMVQDAPLADIVRECAGLSGYFDATRHARIKAGYISCLDDLRDLVDGAQTLLAGDTLVITHGELCASDFIVEEEDGETAWLVDWESGVVSSRYLDLGLFMAHAVLAGEMGFCRNDEEKLRFLETYCNAAGLDMPVQTVLRKAALFEEAATLRAMIWNCVALTGNTMEGKE